MSVPTRARFAIGSAVLLIIILGACTAPPPPAAATATLSPGRLPAAPSSSPSAGPVLVAFPTLPPPSPTFSAANTVTPAATITSTQVLTASSSLGPVVQVVAPANNALVSLNQTVYVIATVASDNGIARVDLSADGILVHSENAPSPISSFPSILSWTPTQIGNHVLRVVAYDVNNLASTPEDLTVTVVPDARRPLANIVFPIGQPQVELGNIVRVQAVASDDVGVTQFDLLVDNQLYTYVTTQNPNGQAFFPAVFVWRAMTPGSHTLVVRSHDSQNQTADSSPLKVFVTDSHPPAVSLALDRTSVLANEPISVTITAVDISGIQRVELWTGREISGTISSSSAARQTYMTLQMPWQSGAPGDYTLTARAVNANGNYKESPPQIVSVLRPGQATPTRGPTPTPTRTPLLRPTMTPTLQPPAPPSAQINQPTDRFSNLWPIRVVFSGQGNAELDRVELWGYYQDQLSPQLICTIEAHATTERIGQCDWSPMGAGLVYLFAQAVDVYNQIGRSAIISGFIGIPNTPTPTPTPAAISGRWTATIPTGQYVATVRMIGTAVRGDFKTVITGTETVGRITSGAIRGDRVTFHVDFGPATTPTAAPTGTPTASGTVAPTATATVPPSAPSLDFDCGLDSTASSMDCKTKDSRGRTGTALFKRE